MYPDIAVIGHPGAGKSTAAIFLAQEFGYTRLSFATPLREVAVKLFGESAYNDRRILQGIGMALREIESDVWLNLMEHYLIEHDHHEGPFVIDDCRFPNEAEMLEGHGFVFVRLETTREQQISRLTRTGKFQTEEQLDSDAEIGLDDYPAKYVFRNEDDVYLLYENLVSVLRLESD